MNILLFLIPITLALAGCGLVAFLWTVKNKQYDDLEGSAKRILFEDEIKK
jgi:cbb3-type cytochrome oxidase maturation protein